MGEPQATPLPPDRLLWAVFLSNICNGLAFMTVPSFIAQKVCSPGGQPSINEFICDDMALVAEATSITIAMSTIRSALGAISALAFGYWRDKTGHNKRLIYISEFADLVKISIYILAAWQWSTSAWVPAILDAVVSGVFGQEVHSMGVNCIIIESSKPEERTMRLQRMGTSMLMSMFVAMLARGYLLTAIGYYNYFWFIFFLRLVSIVLVRSFIQDVRRPPSKKQLNLVDTLKTVFKPRLNFAVIWLMLVAKSLFITFFHAENTIRQYYMQQAFKLTMKDQTLHGIFAMVVHTAGNILNPLILIKYLKWSDLKIGVVSSSVGIMSAMVMAFNDSKVVLYITPFLDTLKFNLMTIPQVVLSKCVRNDELGLYTGFSSLLGIVLPFFVNNLYKSTFSATSQTMPGAVFLLTAAGCTLITLLFCCSAYLYVDPEIKKERENTESDTDDNGNVENKKTD